MDDFVPVDHDPFAPQVNSAAPPQVNFEQANSALGLSEQERSLYQRHLTNVYGPGGVDNADGTRSSLFALSFDRDGKTYNIPTVFDGKILHPEDAIARAAQEGLDKFPSYGSAAEAEARYKAMHDYMERDTQSYQLGKMPPQSMIPVEHNPFAIAPGSAAADAMTHSPEMPNPAKPYVEGAKAFATGGIHDVLKRFGVQLPAGVDNAADFFKNQDVNIALNMLGIMVGPAGARALTQAPPHPVIGRGLAEQAEHLPSAPPGFDAAAMEFYRNNPSPALIKDSALRDAWAEGTLNMRRAAGITEDADVWKQSGWAFGKEGAPQKELADLGVTLEPINSISYAPPPKKGESSGRVQYFRLNHPAGDIHATYNLPPIKVTSQGIPGDGKWNPKTGEITVFADPANEREMALAVRSVLHEVQHHIQEAEGFAKGSNPVLEMLAPEYWQAKGEPVPSPMVRLQAAKRQADFAQFGFYEPTALQTYRQTTGETQSRNVEFRRAGGYRYLQHPSATEDVPRSEQIVRMQVINPRDLIPVDHNPFEAK